MLRYDHFIFDFDGTLSDSYPSFFKAAKVVVEKYGADATDEQIYQCLKWRSAVQFFDSLELGERRESAVRDFNEIKRGLLRTEATAMEGASALLKTLCDVGAKCYIYSHSGGIVIENSQKWGIDVYLTDYFLGSSNYPRKPAPDALLALVDKHKLDISRCVMIGDRDIDVIAGKNAGMDGILLDEENYYHDLEVTHRVSKLMQIADIAFI